MLRMLIKVRTQVDASYFESYSYFTIHREMLGDAPRTVAYRDALERNPSLLRGAKVLDVGCGTGILSLFAARGGASAVVGVDGSDRMAAVSSALVAANGYGPAPDGTPGTVSIVAGKFEELPGLPHEQFDVIVSEWMGYCLLFESMLDTVLHARDTYLKPGGALLPDVATYHVAGVSRVRSRLQWHPCDLACTPVCCIAPTHRRGSLVTSALTTAACATAHTRRRRRALSSGMTCMVSTSRTWRARYTPKRWRRAPRACCPCLAAPSSRRRRNSSASTCSPWRPLTWSSTQSSSCARWLEVRARQPL